MITSINYGCDLAIVITHVVVIVSICLHANPARDRDFTWEDFQHVYRNFVFALANEKASEAPRWKRVAGGLAPPGGWI